MNTFSVSEERFLKDGSSSRKWESLSGVCVKCLILLDKLKLVPLRQCVLMRADQSIRLHLFLPHMEVFFSHEVLHFACIFTTALLGP